jgi:hypothetical protein
MITGQHTEFSGSLYQTRDDNESYKGELIHTFPSSLINSTSAVLYAAPVAGTEEIFNYSCVCNGLSEEGYVHILLVASPTINDVLVKAVVNNPALIFLNGQSNINGFLKATVESLPSKGMLSYANFTHPQIYYPIDNVPTVVENPYRSVLYTPNGGEVGSDSFDFRVTHIDGLSSNLASVIISIEVWDDQPPVIGASARQNVLNRASVTIHSHVVDFARDQYMGVYVTSLPKKGKIYQLESNNERGDQISDAFSTFTTQRLISQYASKVFNVSSFWGNGPDYYPQRVLGPQDVFRYGDSYYSWSPSTLNGDVDYTAGSDGNGLKFEYNPSLTYDLYGYTEYIEIGINTSVFVSGITVGENRGMGNRQAHPFPH